GERNFNRFGGWLGKNSTMGKNYRLIEDEHAHLLLSLPFNLGRILYPWLIVLMHSPWYNSNSYHLTDSHLQLIRKSGFTIGGKIPKIGPLVEAGS
ncbi:replication factor C subunit 1, partial [Tanacetum coccineum]